MHKKPSHLKWCTDSTLLAHCWYAQLRIDFVAPTLMYMFTANVLLYPKNKTGPRFSLIKRFTEARGLRWVAQLPWTGRSKFIVFSVPTYFVVLSPFWFETFRVALNYVDIRYMCEMYFILCLTKSVSSVVVNTGSLVRENGHRSLEVPFNSH